MKRKLSNRDITNAHNSALDTLLARHAAPTLFCLKTASLFSYSIKTDSIAAQINKFNSFGQKRGLLIRVLYQNENRQWLYIYNKSMLAHDLKCAERIALLEQLGYSKWLSTDHMLERLSLRIKNSIEFPHEIGLFLGYPVCDVAGFIKHKGKDSLLNGCWIVYSNTKGARKMFDCFHICREYLTQRIKQGVSIYDALKLA